MVQRETLQTEKAWVKAPANSPSEPIFSAVFYKNPYL
jgi:hypothetical protein